jgi:hypothetical protein
MVYNPATDFVGLWRLSGGNVAKAEMPGLDFVIEALARAGVITVVVSATAPVVNQSITAWLRAATPSWTGEGSFFLWDKVTTAYLPATPGLFLQFLEATAGESGVSWWTTTGGAPSNTVGANGDFAVRTDAPYGIYGPKALGTWPATPIPGTVDIVTSASLDNAFGSTPGNILRRGTVNWEALAVGSAGQVLSPVAGLPEWSTISTLLDLLFGNLQGSILYRDAGLWDALPPGTVNQVLSSGGPAANPSWAARTAEFDSGTSMLFRQDNAPTGWTKQVTVNDCGLRLTSGTVQTVPGNAFSTIFAQTVTGDHTVSVGEMPSHSHGTNAALSSGIFSDITPGSVQGSSPAAATNTNTGGGGAHNHSINLTLAYVDVINAVKN